MFAFAFARFHRKLVDRLGKKGLLPAILLHGGQLDASADESEEIHIEPPAYMDDFFLPVVSDTAAGLLPRVALTTQVAIETAREHGLQLNMTSKKTEAVVDFRGKVRQQVLEDLALEFPVVDGQWTPTVHVADIMAEKMMLEFGESGHPVFCATGPLSRGQLKSKGGGKLSIHYCAHVETIETIFR